MNEQEIRDKLADRINALLGHDGVDGTYYYVLTRVKEAFGYGTMTFDDFVEVDQDFTSELVDLFMDLHKSMNGVEGK